jgi:hypothetical protein
MSEREITALDAAIAGKLKWWQYAEIAGIAILCVMFIMTIGILILYGAYYKYSLLTGSKNTAYTYTTSTASSSYVDLNKNTVAVIWPAGSIEYTPNEAQTEHIDPRVMPIQYLPAVTDGHWPTTFTYSLLYSNVFGPFKLASPQMVTMTDPVGKSTTMSYPAGSEVRASLDRNLNLVCIFDGPGQLVKV